MTAATIRPTLALAVLMIGGTALSRAQVTYDRILKAADEPQNWLTYSGGYKSWRYSKLDQINPSNAGKLALQWAFQSADLGQFETTPLEIDGVLYGTGQDNRAFALDARTGRAIWRYQRQLAGQSAGLLRHGESRFCGTGRTSFHGYARRARHGFRHEDRQRHLGCRGGGLPPVLCVHGGSARGQGQNHRRRRGRRVRSARLHRCLLRGQRQARVAFLYRPGSRRAGP